MIEVRYKCACMPVEASIMVPFRRPKEEDVVQWMQNCMGLAIYLDHRQRSPSCRATAMEYAKVPAPENAPFIGGKPEVN